MARILVIAHRPLLRQALQRALVAWRHDALSTCDPMLGIELALTLRPELVVIDHEGPVLDGAAVLRDLHEVLRDECPRVLLLARARGAEAAASSAPAAPRATVLLPKPCRSSDVRDAISRALSDCPAPKVHILTGVTPSRPGCRMSDERTRRWPNSESCWFPAAPARARQLRRRWRTRLPSARGSGRT